ncbi:DUF998 domain-containing protein [Luteococcus sp. H138]|uniref:DUF998 domain-containing protein n=1 Tax=unclassified Luteococcus TaxID=2639923 RepID=UPI00313D698E
MVWTRKVTGLLLMLGGLLYSVWLLEFLVHTDLSPITSYVSELGAEGEPNAWLFRLGDTLAGLSLAVAGLVTLLVRRRDRRGPRGELWMYRLLTVFGIVTVLDASFPMSCVATRDQACHAREAAGAVPWTHIAHEVTSVLAGTALWIAFLVLLWRRSHRSCWIGRRGRQLLTGLFIAWMATTAVTLALHLPGLPVGFLGAVQRLELLFSAALLLVLGWRRFDSSEQPLEPEDNRVTVAADPGRLAATRR